MSLPARYKWVSANHNGISSAIATTTAGVALPLTNGQLVSNIFTGTTSSRYDFSYGNNGNSTNDTVGAWWNNGRYLALTSANDLSGTDFTITGYKATNLTGTNGDLKITSEILVGPNNNTVYSANIYSVILSIVPDTTNAVAGLDIGWGGGSLFHRFNHFITNPNCSQQLQLLSGTFAGGAVAENQTLEDPIYWRFDNPVYPQLDWVAVASFPAFTNASVFFNDNIVRGALQLTVANPDATFTANLGSFAWYVQQQGNVGY